MVIDGTSRLHVWIDPKLKRAVKMLGVSRGVTMRELVEEALEKLLEDYRKVDGEEVG